MRLLIVFMRALIALDIVKILVLLTNSFLLLRFHHQQSSCVVAAVAEPDDPPHLQHTHTLFNCTSFSPHILSPNLYRAFSAPYSSSHRLKSSKRGTVGVAFSKPDLSSPNF